MQQSSSIGERSSSSSVRDVWNSRKYRWECGSATRRWKRWKLKLKNFAASVRHPYRVWPLSSALSVVVADAVVYL